ncbi:MAG TPA: NADH-quinone oxidoreductase subunit J [Burkholderiaceae bacterium]|nr:NADH-quinone oxidoreductase subunit J [Burkholderiaceae bacterium]
MDARSFLFYVFAAVTVFAAVRVVTARNPVHSALFLVLTFFSTAAIWLMLKAEFLAITLVLVYIGAVMVLFLFVVMMLDINLDKMRQGFWRNAALGGVIALVIFFELALVLWFHFSDIRMVDAPALPPTYSNTQELGRVLYTDYVYPFEIAAVVLLVAIIAAIALTLRRRKDSKYQNVAEQVRVKRSDRVRLVSIPSQSKQASSGQ